MISAAHAHRQVLRANTGLLELSSRLLYAAVLNRVVTHHHQATTHLQAIHGRTQAILDFLQLAIHFHTNGLEYPSQKSIHFATLVGEHRFNNRLHVVRQNLTTFSFNRSGHFYHTGGQLECTIHIGILAEGLCQIVGTHLEKPFLSRNTFTTVHTQVQRIVPHKGKATGRIIHLMAADTKVIENPVESIRRNFVFQFAKAHRMHNELALYTRKPFRGKGNSLFITVKGMKRPVFI